MLHDEKACIDFLQEKGALDLPGCCRHCGGSLTRHGLFYRCGARRCRKAVSIFAGSFFAKSRLDCCEVLMIGYLWLTGGSYTSICNQTGHSTATITDYLGHYRQLVAGSLDEDDCVIGGPGIIVEIDESKFGKRKYNRGHRVEGVWVVGGVERTEKRAMFVEVVSDRTAETLLDIIMRRVHPGSVVHTDLWKGYLGIESLLGLDHYTVNHSKCYVDPISGCHTNTIEGTWNGIKIRVAPRNRNARDMTEHLLEFIWRRKQEADLWNGLLDAFKKTAYLE